MIKNIAFFLLSSSFAFCQNFTDVNNRNFSLDTDFLCMPENKIISTEDRIASEQCNMDKTVFLEYKNYIKELNLANNNYKEFSTSTSNLTHPLLEIDKLYKEASNNTGKESIIMYRINSLKSLLPNIKPWPIKYIDSAAKKINFKNKTEAKDLYLSYKKDYFFNKRLNFRVLSDRFYSKALYLEKNSNINLLEESIEEGDDLFVKLPDYSSFSKDFSKEYERKYSIYVESKNNFNRRAMKLVNDDFAPFVEFENLLKEKERLEKDNLDKFQSEYSEVNERILALNKVLNNIKMYRARKFSSTQFNKSVRSLLNSRTSLKQLNALMNYNFEQRNKYFKYKSQYWFEFFNYKYQLYREAVRIYYKR